MSKSAGPSAYSTKASNQVENVLEARGLGLQLFSKGLLEKNRDGRDLPHLLATRSASGTLSPGMVLFSETKPSLFSFPMEGQPPLNTVVAERESLGTNCKSYYDLI